jgi:hypothetical protein
VHLADQVTHAEIKLIDGKRHYMAVEAIEKLKKVTYDQPALYSDNLKSGFDTINSLAILPQEKDKLLKSTHEELSYSAALGTIKTAPEIMLDPNNKAPWKVGLSFADRVKLEHQATSTLHHRQQMIRTQVRHLSHSHFQSLLHTGKGIAGFDNLLKSFAVNDPERQELEQEAGLHLDAFFTMQKLKELTLTEGKVLLKG